MAQHRCKLLLSEVLSNMSLLMVRGAWSSGEIRGNCFNWENEIRIISKSVGEQSFDSSAVHRNFFSLLHFHDVERNGLAWR